MSQRKQKTIFRTGNTASNSKTAIDSNQKPTPLKYNKLKQEVLPARNLMSQFQKLQPTPKKTLQHYKISQDKDNQSSINESSQMSSDIYIQNATKMDFRQQSIKYQLPKSYIIAMGGLQEAVKQRDNQLNDLTLKYQEQQKKRQAVQLNVKQLLNSKKQLQKAKEELLLQIKFLKQVNLRQKQNHQNSERIKNQYHVGLMVSKQKLTNQVHQLKRLVDQLEAQKRVNLQNINQNETHKQKFIEQIQTLKQRQRNYIQKYTQSKMAYTNQIQKLEKQLKNQKQLRQQAEKQITILKNQLNLLAERTIIAQKKELDSLLAQKTYLDTVENNMKLRVPLVDLVHVSKSNQIVAKEQTKANIKPQKSTQQQKSQDIHKLSLHNKKATENSLLSRDRSTSRVKNNTQRPQVVSQYRQLLRYEKESIALNYQLQLIQKSLAGKSTVEGRNQLQRSYQKLKREAQQKQLQIRELKCFLNDSKK